MKQSNIIIILILCMITIIIAAFVFAGKEDTQVLIVNISLEKPPVDDISKIISRVDASISYMKRMDVREDTPLIIPGITVMVIQDMQEKSGWFSIPINRSESIYGDYTLTVKMKSPLDPGKPVRIISRVLDPAGKEISVKATDIMLS